MHIQKIILLILGVKNIFWLKTTTNTLKSKKQT